MKAGGKEEFSNDVIMLKWHLSFGIEMDIFEKI